MMDHERIVAVYDNAAKAKDAALDIESPGFSSSEISLIHRDSLSDKGVRDGNLWPRLLGGVVSHSESASYNRALQSEHLEVSSSCRYRTHTSQESRLER